MNDSQNRKNYIHQDTFAQGKFKTGSDMHVGGKFEGEIESKGRVTIEQTGEIKGSIKTNTALIQGTMEGKMEAEGDVFLTQTSSIHSDVIAASIKVEPGARLQGNFVITPNAEERKKHQNTK